MKLKLYTDFWDYYDHHFDREGQPFMRMSRTTMTRLRQLEILRQFFGLPTPEHGRASELVIADPDSRWVVHFDEYAHRGEGKRIDTAAEILLHFSPDTTVVKFIGEVCGSSERHLQIGARAWTLSYQSADDWRSNTGDVTVEVVRETEPFQHIPWKLFAIDFIHDAGARYAIDFNTSPGMRGTGMENVLRPAEVVFLIKSAVAAPSSPAPAARPETNTETEAT